MSSTSASNVSKLLTKSLWLVGILNQESLGTHRNTRIINPAPRPITSFSSNFWTSLEACLAFPKKFILWAIIFSFPLIYVWLHQSHIKIKFGRDSSHVQFTQIKHLLYIGHSTNLLHILDHLISQQPTNKAVNPLDKMRSSKHRDKVTCLRLYS